MNNETPSPRLVTTLAASDAPSDAASDTDGGLMAEEALPHERERNVENRPQDYQHQRGGLQPPTFPGSHEDLPRPSSHPEGPTTHSGFTGDSSTIGLTREVFGFNDSQHRSTTSAMPGGTGRSSPDNVGFQESITETAELPPAAVVEALLDTYFDAVHWFMFILHENSFREQARRTMDMASSDLTAEDAEFRTLLMMVLAFGAQYAAKNPKWKSRAVIEKHSINLNTLTQSLIQHVRSRLFDSLERSAIYGRPSTIDRAFCDISFPDECDDSQIPMPLRRCVERLNGGKPISRHTFHTEKYRLYDMKAQIVNKIYTLRGRKGVSTAKGIVNLVNTICGLDKLLRNWYDSLPLFLKYAEWKDMQGDPFDGLEGSEAAIPASQESLKRHMILQVITLQVSYDNILILLHRPLLEYKMSSHREGSSPEVANGDPFAYSFNTCMASAMRISRTPAHKFEYDMPLALMCMHMFTAGVILCIPATMSPFSYLAHNAKAGVVRIIQMQKRLSNHTPIALQSHAILEELMKVAIKRELDMMLQPTEHQQSRNNYEESMGFNSRYMFPTGESTPVLSPSGGMPSGTVTSRNGQLYANHTSAYGQRPPGESQLTPGAMGENNSSLEFDAGPSETASYSVPGLTNTNDLPLLHPTYEGSTSAISCDGVDYGQNYSDLGAELDDGFNSAFGALEKVMYDFAPLERLDPAWMHSIATSDLQLPTEHRPQDGLSGSEGASQAGLPAAAELREDSDESRASQLALHGGATAARHIGASLHNFTEPGPPWLWGLNRIT
ncbi:hypothetical protein VF21_06579 [Pseudogymnoascus sp. 05NY08]|nr:hypothetical protein VF21_06579 [Pseudogymnoascus sp. 05NY08]